MKQENILSEIYKPRHPDCSAMAKEIIEDLLVSVADILEEFKKEDPDWFVITLKFKEIKILNKKFFQL